MKRRVSSGLELGITDVSVMLSTTQSVIIKDVSEHESLICSQPLQEIGRSHVLFVQDN